MSLRFKLENAYKDGVSYDACNGNFKSSKQNFYDKSESLSRNISLRQYAEDCYKRFTYYSSGRRFEYVDVTEPLAYFSSTLRDLGSQNMHDALTLSVILDNEAKFLTRLTEAQLSGMQAIDILVSVAKLFMTYKDYYNIIPARTARDIIYDKAENEYDFTNIFSKVDDVSSELISMDVRSAIDKYISSYKQFLADKTKEVINEDPNKKIYVVMFVPIALGGISPNNFNITRGSYGTVIATKDEIEW